MIAEVEDGIDRIDIDNDNDDAMDTSPTTPASPASQRKRKKTKAKAKAKSKAVESADKISVEGVDDDNDDDDNDDDEEQQLGIDRSIVWSQCSASDLSLSPSLCLGLCVSLCSYRSHARRPRATPCHHHDPASSSPRGRRP